jgi:hypothetical protein
VDIEDGFLGFAGISELDQETIDEPKVEVMLALADVPVVLVIFEIKNKGLSVFKRSARK